MNKIIEFILGVVASIGNKVFTKKTILCCSTNIKNISSRYTSSIIENVQRIAVISKKSKYINKINKKDKKELKKTDHLSITISWFRKLLQIKNETDNFDTDKCHNYVTINCKIMLLWVITLCKVNDPRFAFN